MVKRRVRQVNTRESWYRTRTRLYQHRQQRTTKMYRRINFASCRSDSPMSPNVKQATDFTRMRSCNIPLTRNKGR